MKIPQVAAAVANSRILGLGESSHGTHDFFDFKSQLFRRLVQNHGFDTLLFEDSKRACDLAADYILGKSVDPEFACSRLYPVWRTKELKQLIVWLKQHQPQSGVKFIGFDIDQTNSKDLLKRDELMAKNIEKYCIANPDARAVVWAHNSHIQSVGSNWQPEPMGYFLKQSFGQQYRAMALLFGRGSFSATRLKAGQPPGDDRTLSPIEVGWPAKTLAEFVFDQLTNRPVFMTKDEVKEAAPPDRVRSIGWGLVPEEADETVEGVNLKQAFDFVAYFPKGRPSHPLPVWTPKAG